ncbi:S-layer homology domain-containing protein [Paenibacillus thalictri]|uniref:SLH domain-containing protein n=1 Tax=Paenibacillus thalictri TaxID=2527873 RepID=A0A4Q9DCM1_9BACL|nr:S-layer homology domain-containing protein [Paenibacillus thalictri]TBL68324.1 hypothetical protein EYB31_38400 [Paenibacillus thalictri]
MFLQKGRSILSVVLVFVLLFSILTPAMASEAAAAEFEDIHDSYAQKEIQSLVDTGVISGYEDGSFQPNKAMSRAELAKIIALSLGLKENAEKGSVFNDVDRDGWYNGFVGALVETGITQGTSETTFAPDAKVTREELVVFFIRAMGLEETAGKLPVVAQLSDFNEVSSWAQAPLSLAFKIGFVNGIENADGSLRFSPRNHAERQALARLAYEFKTNKAKYIDKAKELVHSAEFAVSSVNAVNNSTIEVTFNREILAFDATDFTFDNGLSILKVELKSDSKSVIVLTTSAQTEGTVYKLSYKGKDTGKMFTGLAAASFGGGGGGGGGSGTITNDNPAKSDLDKLNSGGTYDSLTITASGTAGPSDGTGKTIVTGTLTLNPGASGEITLQNVVAANIVVASGSPNSIKLANTMITTLRVAAANQPNPVRIESLAGSEVTNTDIQSKVIMESTAGSLGMIKIGSGAQGQEIELRGTIKGDVTVEGQGATIKLAPPKDGGTTSVANLNVGTNATIAMNAGVSLDQVTITGSNTNIALAGEGEIRSVTVSSEAEGATLNLASTHISSIHLNANIKLEGTVDVIGTVQLTAAPGIVVEVSADVVNTLKDHAISAIAAIGDFNAYSAEIDARIMEAETLANNAILLGVAEADIPDYSTKLFEVKRKMTGFTLDAANTDLKIVFAGNDSVNAVTENITLPIVDAIRGVSISWKSSNSSVVSSGGIVTRPAFGEANAQVDLTARLSKNGQEREVVFSIIVLAQSVPTDPTAPTLVSLTIEPNGVINLTASGAIQQLIVMANYSNGTVVPVTNIANYTSGLPAVATVSKEGIVTAAANGTAVIAVSYGGKTASVTVIVDIAALTLRGIAGDSQVSLLWSPLGTNVTYQVYGSTVSGSYTSMPASVTSITYTASRLNNGTPYYFIVKAVKDGMILTSNEVSVTPSADAVQKTATPKVNGSVYPNGFVLTGTTEPRLNDVPSSVTLSKQDGTIITGNGVGPDGSFRMMWLYSDSPNVTLSAGEELLLTAQVYGQAKSDPVKIVVQNTNGQTAMPTVSGIVYETGNSGYAEPEAYVILKGLSGYSLTARAEVGDGENNGFYFFHTSEGLKAGDQVTLTAVLLGKATSDPVTVTVQPSEKTMVPTFTGYVYPNGAQINGKSEPRSVYLPTLITLSKQNGTIVAMSGTGSDGLFTINDIYPNVTLLAGEELLLTAEAFGKKKSDPVKIIVQATSGRTAPVMTDIVNDTLISGWAQFGSLVRIKSNTSGGDGNDIWVRASMQDGYFSLSYLQSGIFNAGDQLTITATLIGQETSDPIHVTVQSAPKTDTPSFTGNVYPNALIIQGKAEEGAFEKWTKVTLSKQDGTYLYGIGVSSADGAFYAKDLFTNPDVSVVAGEELLMTAQAYGKKTSDPVKIIVQEAASQTAAPRTETVSEAIISGSAEPGAIITIKKGSSKYVTWMSWTNDDGTFSADMLLTGLFNAGDQVTITATVMGKATSVPVISIVQASPKTAMPVVNGNVYPNGFTLNGSVDSGSRNTDITLTKQDGTFIGSYSIASDSTFSAKQVVWSYVTLTVGEEIWVMAQAYGKKKSDPVKMTVQATSGQTAVPTFNDNVIGTNRFSGHAEPGAIITLKSDTRGYYNTTIASPDGSYSIYWPTELNKAGDQLSLSATTIGKATSDTVHITLVASP